MSMPHTGSFTLSIAAGLFIPFLLDKVAGQASLNQADGIHPNPEGAAIVADTVWNVLKPLLDQISVS